MGFDMAVNYCRNQLWLSKLGCLMNTPSRTLNPMLSQSSRRQLNPKQRKCMVYSTNDIYGWRRERHYCGGEYEYEDGKRISKDLSTQRQLVVLCLRL